MGHKVSRHKTYLVSRSDKYPDLSTMKRQLNTNISASSTHRQDHMNGNISKTEKLTVQSKNSMQNGQPMFNGKLPVNQNPLQAKDLNANNNIPKKKVQLTQPILLHTPVHVPSNAQSKQSNVHVPSNAQSKPSDVHVPSNAQSKQSNVSDDVTLKPIAPERSPLQRLKVTKTHGEQITKPTSDNVTVIATESPLLRLEKTQSPSQPQPMENGNDVIGSDPKDSLKVNHESTQFTSNNHSFSKKENKLDNDVGVNPLTGISNTAFIKIQTKHKRQRSEDLEPIPYPVTFVDDEDVNGNEIPAHIETSSEKVSYPAVYSESEYNNTDIFRNPEMINNLSKPEQRNGNGEVTVYVVDDRVQVEDKMSNSDSTLPKQKDLTKGSVKRNGNPVKGILKTSQDYSIGNGTLGRNYTANGSISAASSMQNLHRGGETKQSSKQVTIQAPKSDKKSKKVKVREQNQAMKERPASAVFFHEEERKYKPQPNGTLGNDIRQYYGHQHFNGRPTRYVSEPAVDNIAFYESKNVQRPQYFVEQSRKMNRAVPQAYFPQTSGTLDRNWNRQEFLQYRPYQSLSKHSKNKLLLHL